MPKRDKSTRLNPPAIKTVISGNGGRVVVVQFTLYSASYQLPFSENEVTWHTLHRGILLVVAGVVSSGRGTDTLQQTVFISITPYLLYVNRPGLKDPKLGWRLVRGVINSSVPEII